MNYERKVLADIRADIAKLPEFRRVEVEDCAKNFRDMLRIGGTPAGIALALVSAEEMIEREDTPS